MPPGCSPWGSGLLASHRRATQGVGHREAEHQREEHDDGAQGQQSGHAKRLDDGTPHFLDGHGQPARLRRDLLGDVLARQVDLQVPSFLGL